MDVAADRLRMRSAHLRALADRLDKPRPPPSPPPSPPTRTRSGHRPLGGAAATISQPVDRCRRRPAVAGSAARRADRRARRRGATVSGYVGSDPAPVAALRRRVITAIDQLRALASDDPAAAAAVAAARAIGHELATGWLPVLDRLGDDTSMTGWDPVTAGPATVTPSAPRRRVVRHVAPTAGDARRVAVDDALVTCDDLLDGRGDPPDAMQRLRTWLEAHGDDPALIRALLGGLGVDGFADVLLMLGAVEPTDDAVAMR